VSRWERGVGLTKLVRARLPKLETELRYVLRVRERGLGVTLS
jgi:hypothetical protein